MYLRKVKACLNQIPLTVCANKNPVPHQKSCTVVPGRSLAIGGMIAVMITESNAVITDMRQSQKTDI